MLQQMPLLDIRITEISSVEWCPGDCKILILCNSVTIHTVFCSVFMNNKWKVFQQLHVLKTSTRWWWSYKCEFTIDSTSTQIGMMKEVKIFLKTQLLQWKVILLNLQTQMSTGPSFQWLLLALGPLELLKFLLLEIPSLTLMVPYQVICSFVIWFAFSM